MAHPHPHLPIPAWPWPGPMVVDFNKSLKKDTIQRIYVKLESCVRCLSFHFLSSGKKPSVLLCFGQDKVISISSWSRAWAFSLSTMYQESKQQNNWSKGSDNVKWILSDMLGIFLYCDPTYGRHASVEVFSPVIFCVTIFHSVCWVVSCDSLAGG